MGQKPLDGAISAYFEDDAPKSVRKAIEDGGKNDIIDAGYPYDERLDKDVYEEAYEAIQVELVKMQAWAKATDAKVAIVFEGRDAAGKGGTIKRFRENLNPRVCKVVALPKPSDVEASQWYFQRYVAHLPAAGQIVCFDRSWYNRGVVEHVFGFCTDEQRERFFTQVPRFEEMIAQAEMHVIKLWLNVGRAEQLRRFLARESDPLKQWKLSGIDAAGLKKWDAYTDAIAETFERTHLPFCPWTVVRSDDKRRARLAALSHILRALPYEGRDDDALWPHDPEIVGGPEIMGIGG
ncbi:MAG: polyphosphate kinase 2 [Pseudomonadota bacterium]